MFRRMLSNSESMLPFDDLLLDLLGLKDLLGYLADVFPPVATGRTFSTSLWFRLS